MTKRKKPHVAKDKRTPSTGKRMLVMLALIVLLAAGLGGGFYLHVQNLMASAPKPTPSTVSTTKVQAQEWQPQLIAIGNLTAVNGVDVTTEVPGIVSRVAIQSGTNVKAGTELVELNSAPAKAQLAALEAAANFAATTLKRDQALDGVISKANIDKDSADLKSKAALVEQQKALIAQKTIRAPFAGEIGIVNVNIGQYLNPGAMIVSLQDLTLMHVDFLVPQSQIGSLAVGQVANIKLEAFPDRTFPGKVTAINSKVDSNTRNVTVRATVPNPDKLLRPGMFVRVAVDIGEKRKHLTLPQTAITYNSYGSTVFIVKPASEAKTSTENAGQGTEASAPEKPAESENPQNGTSAQGLLAEQVFVTTGDTRGDQVAILKGVEQGQEVVTSGQLKLKTGAPVVVNNSVQPPNDPNPTPQEM